MIVKLKSIEISAFKGFSVDQKYTFADSGLFSLVGKNEDEGGSNGAAKSSFLSAIVAGICGPSALSLTVKELKNRYLDVAPRVKIELKAGSTDVVIDRFLGGKLQVSIDGKLQEGKVDDLQELIYRTLGVTEDQLLMLTYKEQGNFSGFLKMKDGEKKDFLSSFFNLEKIDKVYSGADAKIQNVLSRQSTLNLKNSAALGKLSSTEEFLISAINTLNESKVALEASKSMLSQKDDLLKEVSGLNFLYISTSNEMANLIDKKNARSETLKSELVLNKKRHEITILELQVELNKHEEALADTKKAHLEEKLKHSSLIRDYDSAILIVGKALKDNEGLVTKSINDVAQGNANLGVLETKLKEIECASCGSCGSPISDIKKAELLADCQSRIVVATELVEKFKSQLLSYNSVSSDLKLKLDTLNLKLQDAKAEALTVKEPDMSGITEINKKISDTVTQLQLDQSAISTACSEELANINTEISVLNGKMAKFDAERIKLTRMAFDIDKTIESNTAVFEKNEKNVKDIESKILELKVELQTIKTELDTLSKEEKDFLQIKKMFSREGFIGHIFDGILSDINKEVNNNIRLFPNIQRMSIQFSSDKIVKSTGNINKNITYSIYNGKDEVSLESLSGGQQLSMILAVDEALDSVLEKRLGVHLGWKMLDEQFSFIDFHSKESILEFYRTKSHNRLYLVVDHTSEINAAIDDKIVIVKKNDVSYVEQAV